MFLNILILVWGVTELIIGGLVTTKKKLSILKPILESFSYINADFDIEKISDIKSFSIWIGEIVLVEGALYVFLSSSAIYFNMNFIIVIGLIGIIEVVFFNIIMKGIQIFLKE